MIYLIIDNRNYVLTLGDFIFRLNLSFKL